MRVGLASTRPNVPRMCFSSFDAPPLATPSKEILWARIEEARQAREQIKLDLVDTIQAQRHAADAFHYAQLERQFNSLLREDDRLRKDLAHLIKTVLAKRY